ncbi:hypothetical protein T05_5990 [Trichinella murrelli]|uniref:Uncharacterized protein n=1 Tax=Trichinella murrelli TaxID=144512 RepID=A0A0V0TCM3_9BILA|nr:hypothetical protein T05_5990 [Trichinella murrelli]
MIAYIRTIHRPPHQVREKYGCFPIGSDDLKHIKKCTVLHSGCLIALKLLNNFGTQCHSADINAIFGYKQKLIRKTMNNE